MQKNRTGAPLLRGIRQGIALFLAGVAVWIIYLTGNPGVALTKLKELAQWDALSSALIHFELPWNTQPQQPLWQRIILGQSTLLAGSTQSTPTPPQNDTPQGAPAPQSDDQQEPDHPQGPQPEPDPNPPTTTAPDGIVPKTMIAGTSAAYSTSGNVTVYNRTDIPVDVAALLQAAPTLTRAEGPDILIYHSHATEAYTMDGTDIYEESDNYRTLNTEQNMVRIGNEMTAVFEAAGLEVIHDTTLYDYPDYNASYGRSSEGVAKILKENPSIRLVMDVHRDALAAEDGTIFKTVAGTVENCAQVMLVMGSDAVVSHPNWRVNLSLATSIQQALVDKWSTLARPIVLRTARFNQQHSTGSILVEVGTHGNTLQESIRAARLFAETVAGLFMNS